MKNEAKLNWIWMTVMRSNNELEREKVRSGRVEAKLTICEFRLSE